MISKLIALALPALFLGNTAFAKVSVAAPTKSKDEAKYAKQCLQEAKAVYKQKKPKGPKVTASSVTASSDGNGTEHIFYLERPSAPCPKPGSTQGGAVLVTCVSVSDTYPVANGYCVKGKVESITIW